MTAECDLYCGLVDSHVLLMLMTINCLYKEMAVKGRCITVTSGKGGVGKTTTSAAISSGLALRGFRTCVIDFDVGLRNLDLVMGCERRVVYDIVNVMNDGITLHQALIKDKHSNNLFILAASQTRDKDALTDAGVVRIIEELKQAFDYIVCDSPAGIERGAIHALYHADDAIVVVNPEVSSVRDSDRILGLLQSRSRRAVEGLEPVKEHLLISRYDPIRAAEGQMLSIDDVVDILACPLLGVILESREVLEASNRGVPVVHERDSLAAMAYMDAVDRLLGQEIPLRHIRRKKLSFLEKVFSRGVKDAV